MLKYDLVIIGAGILGLAHAYHAASKGYKVLVLEKNSRAMGSSIQNFGQVVPSGFGVKWQQWGRKSLVFYKKIHEEQNIYLNPLGSIYLASDEDEVQLIEQLAEINKSQDYPSHLLTKTECLSMYRGLKPGYVKAGLYFPDEISLDSKLSIPAISSYLNNKLQVEIRFNTLITEVIEHQDYIEINAAGGLSIYGSKLIICNGYEYKVLFPEFFKQADIQIVKLQMMQLSDPGFQIPGNILSAYSIRRYESFKECPSFEMVKNKSDHETFATKYGLHLLMKQNQDGSLILGDSHEYADMADEDLLNFHENNPLINEFLYQEALKMFDLETSRILNTWIGKYSQLKSGDLVNSKIHENIHVVTAIGGKGMTASFGWSEENIDQIFN